MKVILFQTVENVGLPGDIAAVKPGYYRNFLGPRGIAVEASPGNLKQLEQKRKKLQEEAAKLVSSAKEVGERLKEATLTFVMRAGENDRLFGSVTSADVAEKLSELGFDVDKRRISVPSIKTLGKFSARVKLQANMAAPVTIIVERDKSADPVPEPEETEEEESAEEGEKAAAEGAEANAHAEGSAE